MPFSGTVSQGMAGNETTTEHNNGAPAGYLSVDHLDGVERCADLLASVPGLTKEELFVMRLMYLSSMKVEQIRQQFRMRRVKIVNLHASACSKIKRYLSEQIQ